MILTSSLFALRLVPLCVLFLAVRESLAESNDKSVATSNTATALATRQSPDSFGAPALKYRVGFLGIPSSVKQYEMLRPVAWTEENLGQLKALGFNTIQLNVAWGRRPGDEPLNIEDVVELTLQQQATYPQTVPLRSLDGADKREKRRADLRHRVALCKKLDLRTIFHFGAPYNAHARYGDGPPNCISDPQVTERYELLLDHFAREFPGVDDILLYTYDQDAWICSEFGPCQRCLGVPLHKRIIPFLERLAARWRRHSSQGLLWWEPWELSAGQCLIAAQEVTTTGLGLALHCNVAEVMSTLPADRWFKNMCEVSRLRGLPVIAETVLGGASEELEPFLHLSHPLVTLRGVRALAEVPGVVGIKEYYGLAPDQYDPNLSATSCYFKNPQVTDDEALELLAENYDDAGDSMKSFWRLTSRGMEYFPWDTSWYFHNIGRSVTTHSLTAAMLRGQQAHTPSWESTRKAIFMKTDDAQPDPWMLEDVELRCRLAAQQWTAAHQLGSAMMSKLPTVHTNTLRPNLVDLGKLIRRAQAYAFHLRETNLATSMRHALKSGQPVPERLIAEMKSVMREDLENTRAEGADWPEMSEAIKILESNAAAFLLEYFIEVPDKRSKGVYSMTSR